MNHLFTFRTFTSVFLLLSSFLLSTVRAELAPGGIKGRITTNDGQPASFVNVSLKETGKGTTTDEQGYFTLKNVREGQYTLMTTFVGLQTREEAVTVKAGQTATVDLVLSENARQLAEVMVTGQRGINEKPVSIGKIGIRPMDLPQSIAIVDRQVLERQQALTVSDVLMNVNGVYQMGATGGTQQELAGRGFAFGSSNTFKNGVRFNNGVMPEVSALERVEVMKGSSAILFGNVAAGGVINLVTKKPQFQNGGQVSMRVGSYRFFKPSLDIYGAVNNSDKVAYRINTTYENAGSFRDEVSSERFYINPSLLVKLGARTEVLVEADYLKDNRTPDFGTGAINYTIADIPRNRFLGAPWSYYKAEQKSATATVTHRFSDNWQLRATGGYQNYSNDQYSTSRPNAGQFVQPNGNWTRSLQRSNSNETYYLGQLDLTGQFKTGFLKHNLLFGSDIDQYQTETKAFNIIYDPRNPKVAVYDTINIFDLNRFRQRTDIPAALARTLTKSPVNRVGVYLQDLLSITDQFKILAGVRYTYMVSGNEVFTYDETGRNPAPAATTTPDRYDAAFTPRFGLVYQPLKTTSFFASYSNSFNLNTGIDVAGNRLAPSFVDQYELGVKNELFNGLLSANVTLYQITNSNLAQTVLAGSPTYNPAYPTAQELAGEVTSKGLEVDLMSKSVAGWSFIGGYSYNDTRYTKSTIYIEGSRLRYNPAHTANASVYYAFDRNSVLKGFNAGLTLFYFGERVAGRSTRLTVANDAFRLMTVPDFTQFDANLGYSLDRLSVRVKVSNLLNKLSYNIHDDNSVNPIAPRMFTSTISYRF